MEGGEKKPVKGRFAPKVPSERLKAEDALKLGSASADKKPSNLLPKQTPNFNTDGFHNRRKPVIVASDGVSGPFAFGPSMVSNGKKSAFFQSSASTSCVTSTSDSSQMLSAAAAYSKKKPEEKLMDMDSLTQSLPEYIAKSTHLRPPLVLPLEENGNFPDELPQMEEGAVTMLRLPPVLPLVKPESETIIKSNGKHGPWAPELKANGILGKWRIYSSGKQTLTIGPVTFDVVRGEPPACQPNPTVLLGVEGGTSSALGGKAYAMAAPLGLLNAVPRVHEILARSSPSQ